ncbi:Nar1p [Malassezia vespertilionis]|uniref:Cytosolic Fe-S cluster assembly factor NAR1 n=1 Tax=Malassezia vespertilionis TaxID=2020962 RepID=A0A2N1JC70_9BASI|nr:Nar1p [Malassezia vespertilionis]
MAFSGALSLTDLNDYLGPSQICIKPVESAPQPAASAGETEIAIDDGKYYEAGSGTRARTELETAEISLNDCLACSGCVTSAETVLIGMQSIDEVRQALQERDGRKFIATVSPQSIASLATRYDYLCPPATILQRTLLYRIAWHLRSLGFDFVYDTSFARHLALREHTREFFERRHARDANIVDRPRLPMLASACPGWVCYAEKAHTEMLPFIAQTKSPQQISGVLAKQVIGPHLHADGSVYHVTVMPCYDKKLEASRSDFTDANGVKDVDCVLTTGELHDFLLEHGFDPFAPVPGEEGSHCESTPPDTQHDAKQNLPQYPTLLQEPGTSSGGYLFAIMHAVWQEWVAAHPGDTKPSLALRVIRSVDYTEYVLRAPQEDGGRILFKGAQCYGFRNLQNLVRKVQRETGVQGRTGLGARGRGMARRGAAHEQNDALQAAYDYVEVMACPGGCVNGGGQMRPPAAERMAIETEAAPVQGWQGTDKRWVQLVEDTYWLDPARRAAASLDENATQPLHVLEDASSGPLAEWLASLGRVPH